ncbi:hypothetical protein [Glycomyces buryatensis]|uniref:Uncharacterized protein n=1 Tax=Glycomyces buryatensis TaxID=2570927 RepID=A0A4S8QDL7_9ACTN|nr:hypothetical protein [Glycomyces buryatensis]THV42400.1 hypothetical protein FAB82_07035 [Glycomyces buryatensis]
MPYPVTVLAWIFVVLALIVGSSWQPDPAVFANPTPAESTESPAAEEEPVQPNTDPVQLDEDEIGLGVGMGNSGFTILQDDFRQGADVSWGVLLANDHPDYVALVSVALTVEAENGDFAVPRVLSVALEPGGTSWAGDSGETYLEDESVFDAAEPVRAVDATLEVDEITWYEPEGVTGWEVSDADLQVTEFEDEPRGGEQLLTVTVENDSGLAVSLGNPTIVYRDEEGNILGAESGLHSLGWMPTGSATRTLRVDAERIPPGTDLTLTAFGTG